MKIGTEFKKNGIVYVMGSFGIAIEKSKIEEASRLNELYMRMTNGN